MVELRRRSFLGFLGKKEGRLVSTMVEAVRLNLGRSCLLKLFSWIISQLFQIRNNIIQEKKEIALEQNSFIFFNHLYGIYFIELFPIAQPINTILTLLMNPDSEPATITALEPPSTTFTFIQHLLQERKHKHIPASLSLRPIKQPQLTSLEEPREQSAKDIIKKSIFRENDSRLLVRTNDGFLMKGRMLNGVKKPIQNQMATFLKSINDRILKQMEKSQKKLDLPLLSKNQQKQQQQSAPSKVTYHDIFRNLKELREVRSRKVIEESNSIVPPLRRVSHFDTSQAKAAFQTVASECSPTKKAASTLTAPDKGSPRLQSIVKKPVTLKKGYLFFDPEGKQFLDQHRKNMKLSLNRPSESKAITAKALMVVKCSSLQPIAGRNEGQSIQIASLTKIMTCYLSLLICKKYSIDIFNHQVRVSERAAQTPGTTSELQAGDILSIYQLLLGMMLPSGNDASVALAQALGKVIQRHKQKETKKTYYETFIAHMNILAKQMNLDQQWSNSSGLSFSPNYSTPQAIVLLTAVAVRQPLFQTITNTRHHEIEIKNDRYGLTRTIFWKNTNKLLQNGWSGVKTGTTENAGHCLMARKGGLLVCVFNCQTLARRFSECVYLYQLYKEMDEEQS